MKLLNRCLLRHNLFLLLVFLGIGASIYTLTDLFQRIDVFLDADMGVKMVLFYFAVKLPLIISQILPSIFLLALVLQLSLMKKNREMVALEAGGVSPVSMMRFVLLYGLAWAVLQFAFAQGLGVAGERYSSDIWQNEVKQRGADFFAVSDLWFSRGEYVVNVKTAWPERERANGVTVYEFSPDRSSLRRTYKAAGAATGPGDWVLTGVHVAKLADFERFDLERLTLPIKQDLLSFKTFEPKATPSESSLGDLYGSIERLEAAGTNVDTLRTELHRRFAYAASILVMGLLALSIVNSTENLYLGIFLALILTFVFYAGSSFFVVLGESGTLPPHIAAWALNFIFLVLAGGQMALVSLRTLRHKL
jgi:lipopolysaccharide export system permease protein